MHFLFMFIHVDVFLVIKGILLVPVKTLKKNKGKFKYSKKKKVILFVIIVSIHLSMCSMQFCTSKTGFLRTLDVIPRHHAIVSLTL